MTILGIDEVGRGAVIGPMVIAGALFEEEDVERLEELDVKDSKLLTPERREELSPKIKEIAKDYVIIKVSAKEIDELRERINLNKIEAEKIAQIIKILKPDKAIVDAPQVSTDKFKTLVVSLIKNKTEIFCENYADLNYIEVAAASVIAKVERDKIIEEIKKETGFDCGVGYSHDSRAIGFINKFLRHKDFSKYIRHSWVTTIDLKNQKEQKDLNEFNK